MVLKPKQESTVNSTTNYPKSCLFTSVVLSSQGNVLWGDTRRGSQHQELALLGTAHHSAVCEQSYSPDLPNQPAKPPQKMQCSLTRLTAAFPAPFPNLRQSNGKRFQMQSVQLIRPRTTPLPLCLLFSLTLLSSSEQ